jgi:hypothetical protein
MLFSVEHTVIKDDDKGAMTGISEKNSEWDCILN